MHHSFYIPSNGQFETLWEVGRDRVTKLAQWAQNLKLTYPLCVLVPVSENTLSYNLEIWT